MKRGGGAYFINVDGTDAEQEFAAIDQPGLDPSAAYDLSWAIALLGRAQARLADEQERPGAPRSSRH